MPEINDIAVYMKKEQYNIIVKNKVQKVIQTVAKEILVYACMKMIHKHKSP